jgi:hypothetical protein
MSKDSLGCILLWSEGLLGRLALGKRLEAGEHLG